MPQEQANISVEDEDDEDDDDAIEVADQISVGSGSTTHSTAEREALDFETLVDSLSDLFSASSKLLGLFDAADEDTIANLHKQFQTPGSQDSARLTKLFRKFERTRGLFGTSGYLINQSVVIQVLRHVTSWSEVGNGPWRPDAIIQLANLAEIMAALFPAHRDAQSVLDPLAHLHHNFPSSFMNELNPKAKRDYRRVPGPSRLLSETFELALELRTQYVVKLLMTHANDPNFDPDDIARLVFYSDLEHFRGWDIDILNDGQGNATKDLELKIQDRVESLREHFSTNAEEPVDFESLDEAFPWMNLLTKLCRWAQLRTSELKAEIKSRGGADEIEDSLRNGVKPDEDSTDNAVPVSQNRTPRSLLPAVALTRSAAEQYVSSFVRSLSII